MQRTLTALVAALLILAAAVAPAAADHGTLSIDVEQDADGEATVTVTHNGTAVENATVTVAAPNATYAGEGEHQTDANGTVTLPHPEEDVSVEITATNGSQTGSATVELLAPSLDVDVEQAGDGKATVTVVNAITGEAADGAAVNVTTVDENATYDGVDEYEADANGTVELPAPAEDVSVLVEATCDCATGSTTADLEAPSLDVSVEQAEEGNASATVTYAITDGPVDGASVNVTTVDGNESYAGEGDYTTDENGTVALPAPEEDVEVEVTAEAGNLTGSTTVELEAVEPAAEPDSFGARVSAFVHGLLPPADSESPGIGRTVAAWVLGHNPGNPPAHAGPPDHAGPDDEGQGPPDFAGAGSDATGNASVTASADGSGGPPSHAGPPDGDRGNGAANGR